MISPILYAKSDMKDKTINLALVKEWSLADDVSLEILLLYVLLYSAFVINA